MVWGTPSRLVQVTVVPTVTVKLSSLKLKISELRTVAGTGADVGAALVAGVRVMVLIGTRVAMGEA